MYVIGAAVLVGVGLWFGLAAVDRVGLEQRPGLAVVLEKSYRKPGQTYTQQIINNRAYTVTQSTPEVYVLTLEFLGARVNAAAGRDTYEAVQAGDTVRVAYQQGRISQRVQVVSVRR
jgi:hypothetical protein